MRYTVKLDCKTHYPSKDETVPILIRISINGKHNYVNTGRKILLKQYDKENKCLKSGFAGVTRLQSFIDGEIKKINDIIEDYATKEQVATFSKVRDAYKRKTGKVESLSFNQYVKDTLKWENENKKLKKWTLKFYGTEQRRLERYREHISIHDIDEKFVDDYVKYLKVTLELKKNSIYHSKSFLRKYTNRLFKEGKLSYRPFSNIEVGSPAEVQLHFLLPEELTQLHDLYDSKELLKIDTTYKSKHSRFKTFPYGKVCQEVLRYFLVACYTGFRHSDIKTLIREHIVGKEIVKQLEKGKEETQPIVRIPIHDRLYELLDMANPDELLFSNPVMENSQTNKYLKKIMQIANIKKPITFHKSRYTFGIVSLLLGIKIEVVRDILGHKELETTYRYAKVVEQLRNPEMGKWNNLNKLKNTIEQVFTEIVCSNCNSPILKIAKGIIHQKKIPCVCQICSHFEVYQLSQSESVLNMV